MRKKVVVIGDSNVGKTSLIFRAMHPDQELPVNIPPTELRAITMKQAVNFGKDDAELMIWDTAGQEAYEQLRVKCYPGTDIVLVVCSRSSLTSLLNIKNTWIPEIDKELPHVKRILVVNKMDLQCPDQQDDFVTDEIIEEAYRNKNLKFTLLYKVSALTGENVQNLLRDSVNTNIDTNRRSKECRFL